MKDKAKRKAVAFFGHFNSTNFGNESTLQAFLYNLRRFLPDTEVTCISTGPEATAATHHIDAIPVNESFFKSWVPRNTLTRALRKIFVGIPSEPVRWVRAFWTLRHTDVLIVPGTGLLTDAYGLSSWGPYNLFKWSLIAKMWRCKLLFVSIGAGPIYGVLGRYFSKTMLSLANYRSYRDSSSKEYMLGIGFPSGSDPVYPDLAFSLPEAVIPQHHAKENNSRPVVGLGVMVDFRNLWRLQTQRYLPGLSGKARCIRRVVAGSRLRCPIVKRRCWRHARLARIRKPAEKAVAEL